MSRLYTFGNPVIWFGNMISSLVNQNWKYYHILNLIKEPITLKPSLFIQLGGGCFPCFCSFLFFLSFFLEKMFTLFALEVLVFSNRDLSMKVAGESIVFVVIDQPKMVLIGDMRIVSFQTMENLCNSGNYPHLPEGIKFQVQNKPLILSRYFDTERCLLFSFQRIRVTMTSVLENWKLHFFSFLKLIYFWLRWVFVAACGVFSSCSEQGLLFVAVHGLLIVVASLVAEHGLQAHGLKQLWHKSSVVVARGLQSAGSVVVAHGLSCSMACGIFPDQGSNPCPLHWQTDS